MEPNTLYFNTTWLHQISQYNSNTVVSYICVFIWKSLKYTRNVKLKAFEHNLARTFKNCTPKFHRSTGVVGRRELPILCFSQWSWTCRRAGPGGNTRTLFGISHRGSRFLKLWSSTPLKRIENSVDQIPEWVRFHWTAKVKQHKNWVGNDLILVLKSKQKITKIKKDYIQS